MRIFVGMGLPPSLRVEFARVQSLLRPQLGDFRWVPPENAHVTLHFLGDTPDDRVPPLQEALGQTALGVAPFTVGIAGLGLFPNRGRVRAAWIGVNDESTQLRELAARIAVAAGAEPPRPYRPHVTLGRPRRGNRTDIRAAFEGTTAEPEPMPWQVRTFDLIRSHLTPQGARYETVARFELGQADSASSATTQLS